jgi:hypothetical protein
MESEITYLQGFASQVLRYIGVAFLSGPLIHAGTLGGSIDWYLGVFMLGILLFILGTYLEQGNVTHSPHFVVLSVVFSIGIGMISGGAQHYFDGPVFAAYVIPLGLCIAFLAYALREGAKIGNLQTLGTLFIVTIALYALLGTYARLLPGHESGGSSSVHVH